MDILVLEPHGDDALISCTSLLYSEDNNIDLITFADGRTSDGLKQFFPSLRETKYIDHENLYFRDKKPLLKTHQVHRDYLNGVNLVEKYNQMLIDEFGDIYYNLENGAYNTLNELGFENYDLIVSPCGLSHPYHVGLRNAVLRYRNEHGTEQPILWYVDKPYISTRYNKEILEGVPKFLDADIEINPGYTEVPDRKDIYYIMSKVYPTEVRLYMYTGDIIAKYPNKYMYNSKYSSVIDPLVPQLESVDSSAMMEEILNAK